MHFTVLISWRNFEAGKDVYVSLFQ